MRTFIAWTVTLAVGTLAAGSASAQQQVSNPAVTKPRAQAPAAGKAAPAQAQPAPLDPAAVKARQAADLKAREELNTLLGQWEEHSKQVNSLSVGFTKIERTPGFGDEYFDGVAMLKPDRACLEVKKHKLLADGKPNFKEVEKTPTQRLVCTGEKVLQYEFKEQVVYVYPLEKEVRQKALQEGPLPFLFNMKADDVKKRYGMTLLESTEKAYMISILPREDIDRESFSRAFLQLNRKTFLPDRLVIYPTQNPNGEMTDYRFKDIRPNLAIPEALFKPVLEMKDWKVILNPGQGQQGPAAKAPQAQPAGAQPKRAAAVQPPMRPAR